MTAPPLGAILAGGAARRMGGAKMSALLAGRPLIAWPLQAVREALGDVVVIAKRDTPLPPLDVPVWIEPDWPRHPVTGILHALRGAPGRPIVVCAGDMPFVTAELVRLTAAARAHGAPAVVPRAAGRFQPLLARYEPGALLGLAAARPGAPLRDTVAAMHPRVLDFDDARAFENVNTSEELAGAQDRLVRSR